MTVKEHEKMVDALAAHIDNAVTGLSDFDKQRIYDALEDHVKDKLSDIDRRMDDDEGDDYDEDEDDCDDEDEDDEEEEDDE